MVQVCVVEEEGDIPCAGHNKRQHCESENKGIKAGWNQPVAAFCRRVYDFKDGRIFYTLSNTDKCVTLKLHGFNYS